MVLADRVLVMRPRPGRLFEDIRINLARPRHHGEPAFAALEQRILDRVLQRPATESPPDPHWPGAPAHALRWAV